MKILITGGAGFIGSHVADACLKAGHSVVIVDDLSTGSAANLPKGVPFYLMDIASPLLEKVFQTEKPDVVDHHAAQMSVTVSARDPVLDARINSLGLLNVLENSRKANVRKFIFISSGGAVYGESALERIPEIIPQLRSRRTQFTSSLGRTTSVSTGTSTSFPGRRCVTPTSTGPARTLPAKRAWLRYSYRRYSRGKSPP